MTSFATSLLSLLLSRPAAPEPSRRRRAKSGLSRPWRGANRSLSSGSPTAHPRLEALEDRCLPSVTINEFPIPTPNSGPASIIAGPAGDGNVWFIEFSGENIGRITPAGVITEFPVAAYPGRIVAGPGGNLWFPLIDSPSGPPANPQMAEMTTSGVVTQTFPLPPGTGAFPTVGPDGNIWFTEYYNSEIGRITPDGTITQFPTAYGGTDLTTGPDGNLWFDPAADAPPNSLGRITPAGAVTLFTYPNVGGYLRGLTVGPDGNLWAADNGTGQIDRFNTAGQLTGQWSTPTPNSGPYSMIAGPDGALWFTETNASQIGRITVDGAITEYPTPTANSFPEVITKGPDGNLWFTEHDAGKIGEVVLNQPATTSTSVASSLSTPLSGQGVTFTATVSNTSTAAAPAGSVEFYDGSTDLGPGTPGSSSGNQATWTLTTSALSVGGHTITAVYSGTSNFVTSQGSTSVTVLPPASLSGTVFEDFNDDGQVDFGENGIAGVTVTLAGTDDLGNAVNLPQTTDSDGAYVFLGLRPGSYTITETQPAGYAQGIDTVGTWAGTPRGSLSGTDQFSVSFSKDDYATLGTAGINYNYGEQPAATGPVQKGQAAGIGFWNNKNGQALIKALPVVTHADGSVTSVANWLAATLPHIFGADAGASNDLTGKSNAYVAALFQQDFLLKGVKLDAQVLATALSVYATNATLDSTGVAAQYGFTVSGDGLGTAAVNVGSSGDAFGVANNTTMTVMDLLLAADAQAVNGVLYNGNSAKRKEANDLFSALNQAGGI